MTMSLAAFCCVPMTAAGQAMSLPGKFEVNGTGAATYSVPIAVPPGTAGLVPTVALDYNSQRGNGVAGMGWSLGDLPAIGRCPRTVAQDGARGGVSYDGNDRFCLEGQRLVAISGAYGAHGTEYRTEREGFSRIVSYGSAGSGPASFKVWTKSGQIIEFGGTNDSRIEAQGQSSVRVWAVSKVQDTKGNYFTVSYIEDNSAGDYRPHRIDYTGNAAAGLSPYASVRFVYEGRPDVVTHFAVGATVQVQQRLYRIQTYVGENLVLDYRLAYELSPATQRSRLASITLCAADGACLPASTFSYENGGFGAGANLSFTNTFNPVATSSLSGGEGLFVGDWNADGISDILWWNKTTGENRWFVSNGAPTTGLGFTPYVNPIPPGHLSSAGQADIHFGDWNGDGITDLMWRNETGNNRWFISNGAVSGSLSFAVFSDLVSPSHLSDNWIGELLWCDEWGYCHYVYHREPRQLVFADWNGDGITDLLSRRQSTGENVWFVTAGGPSFIVSINPIAPTNFSAPYQARSDVVVGDWNGDGMSDVMVLNADSAENRWFITNGAAGAGMAFTLFYNPVPPAAIGMARYAIPGDWNGDGITDMLFYHQSSGDNGWYTSKGVGPAGLTFTASTFPSVNFSSGEGVQIGDFNGDGIPDVFWSNKANGENRWFVSNGLMAGTLNFTGYGSPIAGSHLVGGDGMFLGDWNGDGITDLMWWNKAGGENRWFVSNAKAPDVLVSVANGLGESTAIAYGPLSKGAPLYTRDSNATYPTVDFMGPAYVVRQVDASNGIGGIYRSTYRYAGFKLHQLGRGSLGFRAMTVRDEQTGIEQTTTAHQHWPFIGMTENRIKTLGAIELNRTHHAYALDNLGGIRVYVKLFQTVENSRELDGTPMPTVTTTHQYDAFGNATQIVVSTGDGYSKTTVNTYTNDATNWILGRLIQATVTSQTPD